MPAMVERLFTPFTGSDNPAEVLSLIAAVGIRGNFMESEHTLLHFRETFLPEIMDRSGFVSVEDSRSKDVYQRAHEKVVQLLSDQDYWVINPDKARAIDEVVLKAEQIL